MLTSRHPFLPTEVMKTQYFSVISMIQSEIKSFPKSSSFKMSSEFSLVLVFCTLPVTSPGFAFSICLCPWEAGTLKLWISINRIFFVLNLQIQSEFSPVQKRLCQDFKKRARSQVLKHLNNKEQLAEKDF